MATSAEYIEYVFQQIDSSFSVRYKKMFGEYMVYVNEKPILLVCDNVVYVKMIEEIKELAKEFERGIPYSGSKEHYLLPIEERNICHEIISMLEKITPLPKKKKIV